MVTTITSVKSFQYYLFSFLLSFLLFSNITAQSVKPEENKIASSKFNNSLYLALQNANNSFGVFDINDKKTLSLAIEPKNLNLSQNKLTTREETDSGYISHEATKHFWLGVGELAIIEFIPWAFAKWVRTWENPEDNWANVTVDSWWNNISQGWEYDGDAFLTNYFAHPYHGSLYFNAGRTNGYDFWESTTWAAVGSGLWEYFGETFRPAFNDWVNTTVNGITLGEILHRLSIVVTDNTATGSRRVWLEIAGALISPVRGFNRLISGETARVFPNPEDRKPDDFLFRFHAGARRIDKKDKGDQLANRGDTEGIISIDFLYGNIMKDDLMTPFSSFQLSSTIATGTPHLTRLQGRGNLFGWELSKSKGTIHRFVSTLNYSYFNNPGFIYGGTSTAQQIFSSFPLGHQTKIVTNFGADLIMMGATPTDYFEDVEGRNYDFGPGVGINLSAAIRAGAWNVVRVLYTSKWLWTQSEPADSKHHLHLVALEAGFPITKYLFVGLGAGVYWRNSAYNYPQEIVDLIDNYQTDIQTANPFVMVYFSTAVF